MQHHRKKLLVLIIVTMVMTGALLSSLVKQSISPPILSVMTVLPGKQPKPFTLTDTTNTTVGPPSLNGAWHILFFGYTSCPDVCPTTLTDMAAVWKQLDSLPQAQRPVLVFVSVDPERDSVDRLQKYLGYFNSRFVGWTGPIDQVMLLANSLGAPVLIQTDDKGLKTFDHSAGLYAINPRGYLRAVATPPFDIHRLAADLKTLVSEIE